MGCCASLLGSFMGCCKPMLGSFMGCCTSLLGFCMDISASLCGVCHGWVHVHFKLSEPQHVMHAVAWASCQTALQPTLLMAVRRKAWISANQGSTTAVFILHCARLMAVEAFHNVHMFMFGACPGLAPCVAALFKARPKAHCHGAQSCKRCLLQPKQQPMCSRSVTDVMQRRLVPCHGVRCAPGRIVLAPGV